MTYLILLRHGESQWNLENRFTGWVDVPLSKKGELEASRAAELLKNLPIDKVYTSVLKRAVDTTNVVLQARERCSIQPIKNAALNERCYGDLQGLNKAETAAKYGAEQVQLWRRSFRVRPPNGESLEDTAARTLPYYRNVILPDLMLGRNVLIVAHGNSLRALVMMLDNLTEEQVMGLNIPTGIPLVYELNDAGVVMSHKYMEPQPTSSSILVSK